MLTFKGTVVLPLLMKKIRYFCDLVWSATRPNNKMDTEGNGRLYRQDAIGVITIFPENG